MKTKANLFIRITIGIVTVGFLHGASVEAQDIGTQYWDDVSGGNFSDDEKWDEAMPGENDWAFFNLGAAVPYVVLLDGEDVERDIRGIRVWDDRVILDLNDNKLNLASTVRVGFDEANNAMAGTLHLRGPGEIYTPSTTWVGGTATTPLANGLATLIIGGSDPADHGAILDTNAVNIGNAAGRSGLLIVQGAGSQLNVQDTFWAMSIGNDGAGALNILDGGAVTVEGIRVNTSLPDMPTIKVDGMDANNNPSKLTLGYNLELGFTSGPATVQVSNGAELDIGGSLETGRSGANSVLVDDGKVTSGYVRLGQRNQDNEIEIINGGSWTASSMLMGHRDGDNRAPRVVVDISGGKMDDDEFVGSRFTVTGNATMGLARTSALSQAFTEYAHLDVHDGGEFVVNGQLTVNHSGRVTIDNGLVQANSLVVNNGWISGDNEAFGTYRLTLREDQVGEPAPFQVTTSANLGDGFMEFVLLMHEDDEENVFAPQIGQTFNVMSYGSLTGHFRGLEPNSTVIFEQDDVVYALNYGSGTDDAITLTVIPEPHTLGLLLAAAAVIALRRRKG